MLTKHLKAKPELIAQKLIEALPSNEIIDHCELSGPGFINIHLKNEYLAKCVQNICRNGIVPPTCERKKILLDFASPNMGKVGNLQKD